MSALCSLSRTSQKGRHGVLTPPPVKELALKYDIPAYQPKTLKTDEAKELFKSLNAELAIVVAYGKILPGEFIHAPKYGCINTCTPLLPKLRGAAPIQWSIITERSAPESHPCRWTRDSIPEICLSQRALK